VNHGYSKIAKVLVDGARAKAKKTWNAFGQPAWSPTSPLGSRPADLHLGFTRQLALGPVEKRDHIAVQS
jgi:hypothetical protein